MNRIPRLSLLLVAVLTVLTLGVSADSGYSSQADPLVSLSYVNDVLGPNIMEQVLEKIEAEYVKKDDASESATSYTLVSLTKGQTLMSKGIVEIVVLKGAVNTLVTSADNVAAGEGIIDLTAGAVLVNGEALPANHSLLIARQDGRGFTVSSDTAEVLVRGDYHITQ